MVFSSLPFLFRFLPLLLFLYFLPEAVKFPHCRQVVLKNAVLFIGSLIFYAWGEPVYIFLMLFSTLLDYAHGILVNHYKNSASPNNMRKAKIAVFSSVSINLFLLGFFKYSDFLIETLNQMTGFSISPLHLPLPIGISFYTFQTMSYTIDVYRGDAKVQKNFLAFATYVTLFPQLIAGPIVQYKTIAAQLTKRKETWDSFSYGIHRFLVGLGKKYYWPIISVFSGIRFHLFHRRNLPPSLHGSESFHLPFRFILTFRDTRIWPLVLVKCLAFIFLKISTIPIFPKVSQNSGGAGISLWEPGFGNMSISPLAETEKVSKNNF